MKLQHIHDLVVKVPEGSLTPKQIIQPLRKAFKPYPWIRFEKRIMSISNAKGLADGMLITGKFEHDWVDRPVCFVTLWFHSGKEDKSIWFSGKLRDRILFDIFATIAHERVHMLQAKKAKACPRNFHVNITHDWMLKRDIQYYGSKIEIDAFGLTSVLEDRFGMSGEIIERYRKLFTPYSLLYKRFLKKKYEYNLKTPHINSSLCNHSKLT
jgi:hypothetical protein